MSEKDIYTNKLSALEKKVVRNTIRNTRDMALKYPRGEDGLTDKQRIFVEIFVFFINSLYSIKPYPFHFLIQFIVIG